jgi:outer membrane autotransporter protein
MNKKLLLSIVLSSAVLANTASGATSSESESVDSSLTSGSTNSKKDKILLLRKAAEVARKQAKEAMEIINSKEDENLLLRKAAEVARKQAKEAIKQAEGAMEIINSKEDENLLLRKAAEDTNKQVKKAMEFVSNLQDIKANGLLDYDGLNVLLKSDPKQLARLIKYAEVRNRAKAIDENIKTNFTNLEAQLAAKDKAIQTLAAEKNTLNAIANKTVEQNARLRDLTNQILSSGGFNELRNSSEVQEGLKQKIEELKRALPANENSTIPPETASNLKHFIENELSRYLVLDPSNPAELPEVQQADNTAAVLVDTVLSTRTVLDSRIGDLDGISSGDMIETYGIWAKGTFSRAVQKAHGKTQGYKLDSKGITIGVDTGDESLVGIAYSFLKNDIKDKTVSKNKEDITSHTINAYGKYTATPEVFISGQVQFGMAEIKKKRATGDAANNIATAKPKATVLGAKAEIGYDFNAMENVHLIPAVGLAYTDVKVRGYKESGSGLNREVGKINANRTSGISSLTAKYFTDIGTMKLIPEVHVNVDYAFFNTKNDKTVITLTESIPSISTPSQELEKGLYNVGASVRAVQSDMFEFTAGYDFSFAKKFQSHTVALKARVNL